jgi:UDP-N-acetyl-D-glucosamine dehydrogenase
LKEITIIGQGYVGLPLAKAFCSAGYRVVGLDSSLSKVQSLISRESNIEDVSSEDLDLMFASGYTPTNSTSSIQNSDAVVICVPTPLGLNGEPDLSFVVDAATSVASFLKPGALVVLESTTYPGTTEEVLLPIFEKKGLVHGKDFFLAFSPERIDPGNIQFGIRNTPKVVGGVSAESCSMASALYGSICENVVPVSGTREAEMSKLLENTYRHVNIALVNELAIVCHQLGIDVREVIRAAKTKPFGFESFYPGPGVGGHCIPIDPNYLNFKVQKELGRKFEFISLATKVNSDMPKYVTTRVLNLIQENRVGLRSGKVLLVGVSYKSNISDVRESPAIKVAQTLFASGLEVAYHDPLVDEWMVDGSAIPRISTLDESIESFDCVVLLQNHNDICLEILAEHSRLLFDTRGVIPKGDPRVFFL